MRRTPWRAVSVVVGLGPVLMSCDGPNRGTQTQPSSASGFEVVVTMSPNTLRGATAGTAEAQGGCATVQAEVSDVNGNLVDGALVFLTTTLGAFPATPTRSESVGVAGFTVRGVYTDALCAKAERGTGILTASAEDAFATTTFTVF
ncbi:MAG: hypothetical protein HYV62_08695 [Candidatus Rokubacteria bacterium]|nr:hypothetical protein [Candidatus Rokubacteria bacterium]